MMETMIRAMDVSDIKQIVEMEKREFGETLGNDLLTLELQNANAHFLVIEKNETVIGYIGAWIFDKTCEVINFVITKEYQSQGYGRKLMNYLIEYAKSLAACEMILDVKDNNEKALGFYYSLGFVKINVRLQYYADGHDAYVLRKDIL